jgi:hypothetical protein
MSNEKTTDDPPRPNPFSFYALRIGLNTTLPTIGTLHWRCGTSTASIRANSRIGGENSMATLREQLASQADSIANNLE